MATALAEVDTGILAALVDGPAPTEDDLRAALAAHTADGSMHPLLFGCALDGQGAAELVEGIVRFVPAPTSERRGAGRARRGTTEAPRGTVFAVRPGTGDERRAYVRLYEGEVTNRQRLTFLRREADGRTTEVVGRALELTVVGQPGASSLTAGNIAKAAGLPVAVVRGLPHPARSPRTSSSWLWKVRARGCTSRTTPSRSNSPWTRWRR